MAAGPERIYLDYNANTPLHPTVYQEMCAFAEGRRGNPASAHWAGQEVASEVEQARTAVADLLGATPDEIVFTSGGTEANNLAILGRAEMASRERCQLVTSGIEHPSVSEACDRAEQLGWAAVRRVSVNRKGVVDPSDLQRCLDTPTQLVSIMFVSNITGVVQDIQRLAVMAHQQGAVVHTDAVQAAGKLRIDVDQLGVDLLSISAHKIYGPTGIGALYVRNGLAQRPQSVGGGHEQGLRSGTLNTLGIIGFGAAARLALTSLEEASEHASTLRVRFCDRLASALPGCCFISDPETSIPSTLAVSFPGLRGEAVVEMLSLHGVAASHCAACGTHSHDADCPPLVAMGLPPEIVRGAVRFSFGQPTTVTEVERAADLVIDVVGALRRVAGRSVAVSTAQHGRMEWARPTVT